MTMGPVMTPEEVKSELGSPMEKPPERKPKCLECGSTDRAAFDLDYTLCVRCACSSVSSVTTVIVCQHESLGPLTSTEGRLRQYCHDCRAILINGETTGMHLPESAKKVLDQADEALKSASEGSVGCTEYCGCGMFCTKDGEHTVHGCHVHYPEERPTASARKHPAVDHVLQFFEFQLPKDPPEGVQSILEDTHEMAWTMVANIKHNPELTVGLRKLLEARDCFVRAKMMGE